MKAVAVPFVFFFFVFVFSGVCFFVLSCWTVEVVDNDFSHPCQGIPFHLPRPHRQTWAMAEHSPRTLRS